MLPQQPRSEDGHEEQLGRAGGAVVGTTETTTILIVDEGIYT